MPEQPEIYDLKFLKGFIRRRKRVFLIVASGVMLATILFAIFAPKTYVSTATFLIEGQMSDDIVKGTAAVAIEEKLQAITTQILSHDKLLEIIKEFKLYRELKSPADVEYVVREMRDDISVRTIKAEDLDQRPSRARYSTVAFTLSFQGKDPVTVQKVASKLSSLFIQKNIQTKEQVASQTVAILEKKIAEMKERTGLLERKLNDYKVAHAGELPEAIPFNYEQINKLNIQIDELNQKIRVLEERKRNPDAVFASQTASDTVASAAAATDPWTRMSQLRMQLVSLQSRYSDKHPEVIRTKSELRQLEARLGISNELNEKQRKLEDLKSQEADLKAGKGPNDPEVKKLQAEIVVLDKEIQKIKGSGAATDPTERELKRLTQQRADLQKRLNEYQRKSQIAPLVQKEYSRIASEYDDALKQYNETMSKLAEVRLARGIDQTQLGERFTIIDEPQVPQKHDKPKRARILLAGLLLSAFCGVMVSFTVENMDHSIKSVEKLQKMTQVPVLAVMPFMENGKEIKKEDRVKTGLMRLERSKAGLINLLGGIRKRLGKQQSQGDR
jgi:polysaccharide chain length determinant protein (PEP-CTERM system associated)